MREGHLTPVELWRCGATACVVTHHWGAQSYEIQVLEAGRLIVRRWFSSDEAAAAFASAAREGRYEEC